MAFDDLLKGLATFSDGLKHYQTTQAVNDAQTQLNQLNASEMDKAQKLQANTEVANNLAMRLTAAGADAAHIQAATSFAPSTGQQFAASESRDLQKQSETFQSGEKALDRDLSLKEKQMTIDAMTGKADRKKMSDMTASFDKRDDVKPVLKDFSKINEAYEMIHQNKGQQGITGMIELAKMGMIHGIAGRVSEYEIQAANESQAGKAKLWKRMGLEANGEVPANIQDFWEKIALRGKQNAAKFVDKAIEAHGNAGEEAGLDGAQIKRQLRAKYGNIGASLPKSDGRIETLQKALELRPDRAADINAKIQKLKEQQGID